MMVNSTLLAQWNLKSQVTKNYTKLCFSVLKNSGRFLVSVVQWTLYGCNQKASRAAIQDGKIGSARPPLLQWTLWMPLDALDAFWGRRKKCVYLFKLTFFAK